MEKTSGRLHLGSNSGIRKSRLLRLFNWLTVTWGKQLSLWDHFPSPLTWSHRRGWWERGGIDWKGVWRNLLGWWNVFFVSMYTIIKISSNWTLKTCALCYMLIIFQLKTKKQKNNMISKVFSGTMILWQLTAWVPLHIIGMFLKCLLYFYKVMNSLP